MGKAPAGDATAPETLHLATIEGRSAHEGPEHVLTGQLDLFAHSRTMILLNDLIDSVLERDTPRVDQLLDLLRAEAPGHPALNSFVALREVLKHWPPANTAGPADTERVLEWLDSHVTRTATSVLGAAAATFIRSLWHELADTVADQRYDPTRPRSHCVYCHLRAGDGRRALEALSTIEGRERDPFLLHYAILARYDTSGWHACRSEFFTLALTAPHQLPATLTALSDPSLHADWEGFWTDCIWLDQRDETSAGWFPAWYLIEHPATRLADVVAAEDFDAPWAKAFRTMKTLLTLERCGYDERLIAARAELQHIDARLFAHYMTRRESQGLGH
ncbi:MAG: hypothetical protein ACREUL_18755 [Steroidobacteraceae bacterium]